MANDDDALVRAALSMILGGVENLRVVGEVADGGEVAAAVVGRDRAGPGQI